MKSRFILGFACLAMALSACGSDDKYTCEDACDECLSGAQASQCKRELCSVCSSKADDVFDCADSEGLDICYAAYDIDVAMEYAYAYCPSEVSKYLSCVQGQQSGGGGGEFGGGGGGIGEM